MKRYRVNEIFYSLQGEGFHTGEAAIFIRLSGCNLRCHFCDTKHQDGRMFADQEIIDEMAKFPSKFVVITGGEPSLQLNDDFIDKLHSNGYYVAVETNGTRPLANNIDWVTLSPKDMFCQNAIPVLTNVDELKVVYDGENMKEYESIKAKYRFLQPCDTGDERKNKIIIEQTVEYIKQHPIWKLSLQTQKILNVR